MMNVYPDSPQESDIDKDWKPITLKRTVMPTKLESWADSHKSSWYVKALEFLGRAYAPVDLGADIPKSRDRIPFIGYVSLKESNKHHDMMAGAYHAEQKFFSYAWHSFCEAASRWPPFSTKTKN